MTTSAPPAAGPWVAKNPLPAASSWDAQHDGPVLVPDPVHGDRVVAAGGSDGTATGAVASAAVYDPAKDVWTKTAADLTTGRRRHTTTALADGTVLVTGGLPSGAVYPETGLSTAEVYDPATGKWTATATAMSGPRWGHSAVLLPDKRVLVAGGTTSRSGSSVKALALAEVYDPAQKTWTTLAPPMTDARSGHAAVVLPGGKVLLVGGSVPIRAGADAALAYCEIYDPVQQTWTPAATLNEPRSLHQATLLSGGTHVLVTGGSAPLASAQGTFDPFSRAGAELYDIAGDRWTPVPPTPVPPKPGGRSFHRAVAVGTNQVLVLGGTRNAKADIGYESAFLFDKAAFDKGADPWTAAGALGTGRWGFGAVALTGGTQVVVTGGVVRAGPAAASPDQAELTAATEVFTLGSGS